MKLKNSLDFIYSSCANRINNKINESCLTLEKIYSSDPKILSSIRQNIRTPRNVFLVPDRVFTNPQNNDGLLVKLDFHNSIQEVLWGTEEEINNNLPLIFKNVILDLLDNKLKLDFSIEDILCDFVPYAKYSTYYKIILSKDNKYPAIFYGVYEDKVIENLYSSKDRAIDFLYSKSQNEFSKAFINFAKETTSFKNINKVFKENFIYKSFIPLLMTHIPDETSLGIRVKNLILADLSQTAKLILNNDFTNDYYRQLINASSEYILKLERIQQNNYKEQ